MIDEGEPAPLFSLPTVRDGEVEQVAAEDFFGEEIVILAFYPGDFNPACEGSETGLDELDLFTMQKDVTVLAISGDSVHSHKAFAEEYGLQMPLLSDSDGSVASAYGVAVEDDDAGYLTQRSVVVVDHTETVQYAWSSDSPRAVPNVESIRSAVEGVGDDETAESRYRVGHAHYMEGRRAFTSAMKAYESMEWMMAQTDFTQAAAEFDEAGDEFNTAVRFAEQEETRIYFERAEAKAEALWRAADWLSESASAFASGEGAKAESLRSDAEAPLESARDLHDPVEPDDFPPDEDPAELDDEDEDEPEHFVPDDGEEIDASLDADFEEEIEDGPAVDASDSDSSAGEPLTESPDKTSASESTAGLSESESPAGESTAESPSAETPAETAPGDSDGSEPATATDSAPLATDTGADTESEPPSASQASDDGSATSEHAPTGEKEDADRRTQPEGGTQIDDEELEEITAELEEQSEETEEPPEPEPANDSVVPDELVDSPDSTETEGITETTDGSESFDQPTGSGPESQNGQSDTAEEDVDDEPVDLDLTDPSTDDGGDEDDQDRNPVGLDDAAKSEDPTELEIDDEDDHPTELDEDDDEDDSTGDHGVPDSL